MNQRPPALPLVRCPKCGGVRVDFDGAHSPHYDGGVLVDCVGQRVEKPAEQHEYVSPAVGR